MPSSQLPSYSTASLIKALIVAVIFAGAVLVTVILPAEYNIDPTGAGKALGLTELTTKDVDKVGVDTVVDSVNSKANDKQILDDSIYKTDKIIIELPVGKGLEYKFKLDKYESLIYEWSTNGEMIYFDFHGEPQGDTSGYFESYAISTAESAKGILTTPFAGSHGWYWKNNGQTSVTITLETQGEYKIIGLLK